MKNLNNIGGSKILSKSEQKSINGNGHYCPETICCKRTNGYLCPVSCIMGVCPY